MAKFRVQDETLVFGDEDGNDALTVSSTGVAAKAVDLSKDTDAPIQTLTNGDRACFLEFSRTGYDPKVAIGALGGIEANLSYNMDYTDGVHRYYDSTVNANWIALGADGIYLQYAPSGYTDPGGAPDIWTNQDSLYNWYVKDGSDYARFHRRMGVRHEVARSWTTGYNAIEWPKAAIIASDAAALFQAVNATYVAGSWVRVDADAAMTYWQSTTGGHEFYAAASDTAGSEIIWGTPDFSVEPDGSLRALLDGVSLAVVEEYNTLSLNGIQATRDLSVGIVGVAGDPALYLQARTTGAVYARIAGTIAMTVDETGLTAAEAFGCNGATAQTAATLGSAATDLATVITLANNIRTALIANGVGTA